MKKLLYIAILMIALVSCDSESHELHELEEIEVIETSQAMYASIYNYDVGGFVYEGLYVDWLISRKYKDGTTYVITLESEDHQVYYGKFIKTFYD